MQAAGSSSTKTRFYSLANLKATKNLVSHILSHRKYKIIFLVTTIAFAVFYMFATGIFFYGAEPIAETIGVPYFNVIWPGDIINDQTPWVIAYLNTHLIFRMSSHAMVSTSMLSLLVGVNAALFAYSAKTRSSLNCECCKGKRTSGSSSSILTIFRAIPASFATFACHGAILLPLLGLPVLSAYSNVFVAASIGALVVGLLVTSNSIRRLLPSAGHSSR